MFIVNSRSHGPDFAWRAKLVKTSLPVPGMITYMKKNDQPGISPGFTGSTPPKIRRTATDAGYRTSDLGRSRTVVLSDLGRVPQMPLHDMMEMLIPSLLSEAEVDAVLEDLTAHGIVSNNKWAAFDPEPSAVSQHESAFFNDRLPKLHRDIVGGARRIAIGSLPQPLNTQTELTMSGSQTPFSQRRNTSMPDGYYAHRSALTVGWDHIAIPIEVKKRTTKFSVQDVCPLCYACKIHLVIDASPNF